MSSEARLILPQLTIIICWHLSVRIWNLATGTISGAFSWIYHAHKMFVIFDVYCTISTTGDTYLDPKCKFCSLVCDLKVKRA